MRTLISQPAGLLLALMLAAATVPVTATGVQHAQPRVSILKRLGYFLQSENRNVRIKFATIALEKMIATYEVELEQLNTPAKGSRNNNFPFWGVETPARQGARRAYSRSI